MRCFLAVELSKEVINELIRIQKELGPFLKAKFVEPENLHLTLRFFPDIDEKDIKDIRKSLKEIEFPKFSALLGKIGFFPNENFIRVLWVNLESEELPKLCQKIDDKLIGFRDNHFESHVTLARIKDIYNKKEFLDMLKNQQIFGTLKNKSFSSEINQIETKSLSFEVKEFVFKKSTLTERGPIYEDLERFELI